MHELINQLSRVARIDDTILQGMQHEVRNIGEDWTQVYTDYHSGGWWTLSLLNNTSNPHDALIEDCVPVETSLLKKMPVTGAFLRGLSLKYMWVRLAKLEPSSFMWEHCDYQDLGNFQRFRLHVPIITNQESMLIIDDSKVHLDAGYIWKLNPIHRHAAGNFGSESRVHILIDCYVDDTLENLLRHEALESECVVNLPVPAGVMLNHAVEICGGLSKMGYSTLAEHHLLKMYHLYRLGRGRGYDLVSQMYELNKDQANTELWQNNKAKFLGVERPEVAGRFMRPAAPPLWSIDRP
jgi:hypothetical protein